MKIGSVIIDPPVACGPMAGVTDLPFRRLVREAGCGLTVTEMVSAKALCYGSAKTEVLLRTDPDEHPVSVQMFGSDPDILAETARKLEEYPFDLIDLNMGCPVPKVTGGQAGMRRPSMRRKSQRSRKMPVLQPSRCTGAPGHSSTPAVQTGRSSGG